MVLSMWVVVRPSGSTTLTEVCLLVHMEAVQARRQAFDLPGYPGPGSILNLLHVYHTSDTSVCRGAVARLTT